MKQLISEGKDLRIVNVPKPSIGKNQILVKNYYSVISTGTEISNINFMKDPLYKKLLNYPEKVQKALRMIKNKGLMEVFKLGMNFLNIPREWGYSSCGEVVDIGSNIKDIHIGDIVACGGAGKANHAEYISVPRNLVVKVPGDVDFKDASITTIGSIAMQGVRQCNPQIGETIVVVGLGLIGQITALILKANGINVIGLETNKERIELAKTNIQYVINPITQNVLNEIKSINGDLVDGVIITASSKDNKILNQSIEITRKRGRIIVLGNIVCNISRSLWYEKEIDFKISYSYGPGRGDANYEENGVDYPLEFVRFTENRNMKSFLDLLANKSINLDNIINKEVDFENCISVYSELDRRPEWLGVAIKYGEDSENANTIINPEYIKTDVKDKLNVGIVGLGNFFMSTILPAINKNSSKYNILGLANKSNTKLIYFSKKLNAKIITTDYLELFKNPDIDLIMAITRHNLHFDLVKNAIEYNKNLFIEKPLCVNQEELNKIKELIKGKDKLPLINIGFNRRFSPLVEKLKEIIKDNTKPVIINYVVNSENFGKDIWINTEEGGGQIVGEGCAMIDLGLYLINDKVKDIQFIKTGGNNYLETGNFVCTIKFNNGSIFNLVYTTLGNKNWPKENIDIFYNNTNYKIIDFKELKSNEYNIKLKKQDKGHFNEIKYLYNSIKEGMPLIPLNDIIQVMEIVFEINQMNNK